MHIVYHYLVTNYFNPLALIVASWSLQAMSLFTGLQITLSQSFFIRRTWIMGRKYKPLVAVAALCSVTQLAISIACTVDIARGGTVENALDKAWFASAINALAVAADVLLTGILIISLHQQRTGITRTDSLITVLMLYAINTGLLQTIVNTVVLVFVSTLGRSPRTLALMRATAGFDRPA
ncbi:hypothetical protein OH77DRAFT_273902 [Trametes cingulata]|nr:hypothetical protein OH77DRAFT_273902 [Trametes cingulata]